MNESFYWKADSREYETAFKPSLGPGEGNTLGVRAWAQGQSLSSSSIFDSMCDLGASIFVSVREDNKNDNHVRGITPRLLRQ